MDLSGLFISRLIEDPYSGAIWILVIVFSICCHEFSHAWMALHQGDPTAAEQGHLTLNPLKQMGVFSLIMLALMGIAWGAVPVNPSRMKHKYSDALVSLAGPLMNLLLFAVSVLGLSFASYYISYKGVESPVLGNVSFIFLIGAELNLLLFLLNMLPLPMLDGWKIFLYIFPKLQRIITGSEAVKAIYLITIMLFIFFIDWIMTFCMVVTLIFANMLMMMLHLLRL